MTTFIYTTTSNGAELTDTESVRDLCTNYEFDVEPSLNGDTISFNADHEPNRAFDVYQGEESVIQTFLEELSEYLKDALEVQCMEVEGHGEPEAWKWTVTPDGLVERQSL